MIPRDQSPLCSTPTPPSAWSIPIIERIASRRVEAMHSRLEMRNTGRKQRFSRNFACFRFPDATNGKKVDSKLFVPLYPSTPLRALLDSWSRSANPPLTGIFVPCFHASFVISSFSFLHFSQPVILFLFLSAFPLLLPLSPKPASYHSHKYMYNTYTYPHTHTHVHTYIHAYTLSTSTQFSLQVYVF